MKKNVLILAALFLISLTTISQNTVNLVIFSEDGDPFYTYINGVKQNNNPETNVKFTGLTPNISLRIEFQDKTLPQLKQTMALEAGFEHTARIKRDMKKQLKLRYFGSVPLNEGSSGINTVAYHTADDHGQQNSSDSMNEPASDVTQTSTSINTTNSSSQSGSTNQGAENVAVNINMAGVGISMNVNATDPSMNTNVNSTTSTTVTTKTSNSNSSYSNTNSTNTTAQPKVSSQPQGCRTAMSAPSFSKMKESVASKPFSETKMSTAKVATKNTCLSVSQIKEIAKLFSMDEDKLTYAKYAYDYCVDKANYYQVSDVFSFSSTTDELNEFLTH